MSFEQLECLEEMEAKVKMKVSQLLESLELDAIAQALRVHALAIHASTMIQF
jgi:hypothetical protein